MKKLIICLIMICSAGVAYSQSSSTQTVAQKDSVMVISKDKDFMISYQVRDAQVNSNTMKKQTVVVSAKKDVEPVSMENKTQTEKVSSNTEQTHKEAVITNKKDVQTVTPTK